MMEEGVVGMADSGTQSQTRAYFETEGLDKQYPGVHALQDFSLTIGKNEILGLAGENGAGKSTLLKILSGVQPSDSGTMYFNGKVYHPHSFRHANTLGVSMVFQEQNLISNLTVYENMYLSHEEQFRRYGFLNRGAMIRQTQKYLDDFELDVRANRTLGSYSFHERQMLEIIRAFIISDMYGVETPLVLLDEPTAALPDSEREVLIEKIRVYSSRASTVFVSHRLSELTELCDRIAVLRDGQLVGEVVPSSCTESDIHTLMVGRTLSTDLYRVHEQNETPRQRVVLKVAGLSKRGEYQDVDFDLHEGEILGIGGLLGSGKAEVGESLFGMGRPDAGTIAIDGKTIHRPTVGRMMKHRIGYVPAERKQHGLILLLQVGWNLSLPSLKKVSSGPLGYIRDRSEKSLIRDAIDRFAVKAQSQDLCYSLSGGNQQKVVVAKWMVKNLDILILNNPTRGIDVGAKEEIYAFIRQIVDRGVSILLISDDLLEVIGLSNRIIIMKDGKISSTIEAPSDGKPSEEELVRHMV